MNLPNAKDINAEYSFKKPKIEIKKESKLSESYDQTNFTDSKFNQKRKTQYNDMEKKSITSESEEDERENNFLGKKTKNIRESKFNKRKKIKDTTLKNNAKMIKDRQIANMNIISINNKDSDDDSESESEDASRKKRTIFVKCLKQKMTESEIKEIFKNYGQIRGVELLTNSSARVEFINETPVEIIMDAKNMVSFKGNKLQIEKALKAIPEKLILNKEKAKKNETEDTQKISDVTGPEIKEKKEDEKLNVPPESLCILQDIRYRK